MSTNRSTTGEYGLDLSIIGLLIRRNLLIAIVVPLLLAGIGFLIASNLAPKFKSLATVGIQASYFQNPLINDLVVQVADPAELQSQRRSEPAPARHSRSRYS